MYRFHINIKLHPRVIYAITEKPEYFYLSCHCGSTKTSLLFCLPVELLWNVFPLHECVLMYNKFLYFSDDECTFTD